MVSASFWVVLGGFRWFQVVDADLKGLFLGFDTWIKYTALSSKWNRPQIFLRSAVDIRGLCPVRFCKYLPSLRFFQDSPNLIESKRKPLTYFLKTSYENLSLLSLIKYEKNRISIIYPKIPIHWLTFFKNFPRSLEKKSWLPHFVHLAPVPGKFSETRVVP